MKTIKIMHILLISIVIFSCKTVNYQRSMFDIHYSFIVNNSGRKKVNADINEKLFKAVKQNNINSVRDSLSKGANPNVHDGFYQSILMWACWNEYTDIVDELLKYAKGSKSKKLSVNAQSRDDFNYNALLCAARVGNLEIYEKLIKNGAYPVSDNYNETILHKAAKSGNIELADSILTDISNNKFNIGINDKNIYQYTPLHLAVIEGDDLMAELLINYGADPSIDIVINDISEISPLSTAYKSGHYEIFASILEKLNIPSIEKFIENNTDFKNNNIKEKLSQWDDNRRGFRENSDYKYLFSLSARINGLTEIREPEFMNAVDSFYSAVEKKDTPLNEIKILGQSVMTEINKVGRSRRSEGRRESRRPEDICLLQAINNERLDVVKYLLEEGFRSSKRHDVLIYAIENAQITKNYEILDYLISQFLIPRYTEVLRVHGKHSINGKTALMNLVEDPDYLSNKNWNEVKRLLDRYIEEGVLSETDLSGNTVLFYIINLETNNNSRLEKLKNDMFSHVYNESNNRFISLDSLIGGKRPLIYVFSKEYYYGANHLLYSFEDVRKFAVDDLLEIIDSLQVADSYLDEIDARYTSLRTKIQKCILEMELIQEAEGIKSL